MIKKTKSPAFMELRVSSLVPLHPALFFFFSFLKRVAQFRTLLALPLTCPQLSQPLCPLGGGPCLQPPLLSCSHTQVHPAPNSAHPPVSKLLIPLLSRTQSTNRQFSPTMSQCLPSPCRLHGLERDLNVLLLNPLAHSCSTNLLSSQQSQ